MDNEAIVLRQSWLQKKSQHIGLWRRRWTVLTTQQLLTYRDQNIHNTPTEKIPLLSVNSITTTSDTMFEIECNGKTYKFNTNEVTEKNEWIQIIDKYRYHCIQIPIVVECPRDNEFNLNFELIIPYDPNYAYSINKILNDITNSLQKK
eukprot:205588_1